MKRRDAGGIFFALLLWAVPGAQAQVEGRFGFEYAEFQPWNDPKHDALLSKLAAVTGPGHSNVNALGPWRAMRPKPSDAVDFSETDAVVAHFGQHGFSLAWNLSPNAPWSYPTKPGCQPDTLEVIPGLLEIPLFKACAPEPAFERYWTDYIKAIVERYDGDGVEDMPGLQQPVRHYVTTGEIKYGTREEGYAEKPQYYTYRLLVEKLHDFTSVAEIDASHDPRTRVYRFERPQRGPVFVAWSETGDAPPNPDYGIPTGETVTVLTGGNPVLLTHVISEMGATEPQVESLPAPDGKVTLQLGYAPVFLEDADHVVGSEREPAREGFMPSPDYPNPFSHGTTIQYQLPQPVQVRLEIFDVLGRSVCVLVEEQRESGARRVEWDGTDRNGLHVATGVYLYRLTAGSLRETRRLVVLP